jgi:hypothetical protein
MSGVTRRFAIDRLTTRQVPQQPQGNVQVLCRGIATPPKPVAQGVRNGGQHLHPFLFLCSAERPAFGRRDATSHQRLAQTR